tara:strand:- start:7300 stop:9225 length:1926 start_codon:yes stop_codon:yes gene_type:complete
MKIGIAIFVVFGVIVSFLLLNDSGSRLFNIFDESKVKIESIDLLVEQLDSSFENSRQIWLDYEKKKITVNKAINDTYKAYSRSEAILSQINNLKLSGIVRTGKKNFKIRKRNAEDIGRAISNFSFALATAFHFHLNFIPSIEESVENLNVAIRLNDEVEKLRNDYANDKPQLGLDKPARSSSNDAQYIFVILLDTTRADHLSAYGYERKTTPNIDKLADEGLLFEKAFAQCSVTDTSVASLMTALYPRTHKMMGTTDWLWEDILIDRFRENDFVTGGFSANTLISKTDHYDHGFDHFEELFWNRATVLINQTIRWLERVRTKHDKIFTYIHLIDPHDIYFAPFPFFNKFDKALSMITAHGLSDLIENKYRKLGNKYPECDYDPTKENCSNPEMMLQCLSYLRVNEKLTKKYITNIIGRYDGEINYSDNEIGRLINYLRKNDMLEKSIIVILSDHGESFLEHNRVKHGHLLYDNQIQVPLIFWRGSHNFGGRRVSEPVEIIDVLPTIFGLIGVDIPQEIHGHDLLNTSLPVQNDDTTYSLTWNGQDILSGLKLNLTTAREPKFKYILTFKPKTEEFLRDEFYNLSLDSGEMHDARDSYPKDFERLKEKLKLWNKNTNIAPTRQLKERPTKEKIQKLKSLGYL